jgi:integrase
MKPEKFPVIVTEAGVSAKIRKFIQTKNGQQYPSFVVEYNLLGKRKREWTTDFAEAKKAASVACRKIASGNHAVLQLSASDQFIYQRAVELLKPWGLPLDLAVLELTQAREALNGAGTLLDAARDYAARRATALPTITVKKAVEDFLAQAAADGKSEKRQQDLSSVLNRFAESLSVEVHTLAPKLISDYLTALPFKERTKRNHSDVIRCFNRWLVLREYLPKETNLLDGVQKYSARKIGEITTYTPEEMALLLSKARENVLPFLTIAGFAGLRHAEIARLDWKEIDFDEGFIEVRAVNSKTGERRLVPIKPNLRAWLLPIAKESGPVMNIVNIANALRRLAKSAGIKWKHNALRHTYISARIAECADIPRVADEAGNSPQIIRTNYLKRIRPAQAAAWFGIMPPAAVPGTLAAAPAKPPELAIAA